MGLFGMNRSEAAGFVSRSVSDWGLLLVLQGALAHFGADRTNLNYRHNLLNHIGAVSTYPGRPVRQFAVSMRQLVFPQYITCLSAVYKAVRRCL